MEEGYRYANKRVRRLHFGGNVPWSPEYSLLNKKVHYLEALLKMRRWRESGETRKASKASRRVRHLARSARDTTSNRLPNAAAVAERLAKAKAEITAFGEKHAEKARDGFLHRKAQSYEDQGIMTKAAAVKRIRREERERRERRKIKSAHRKWRPSRCSKLTTPITKTVIDEEGNERTIVEQEEIVGKEAFFRPIVQVNAKYRTNLKS